MATSSRIFSNIFMSVGLPPIIFLALYWTANFPSGIWTCWKESAALVAPGRPPRLRELRRRCPGMFLPLCASDTDKDATVSARKVMQSDGLIMSKPLLAAVRQLANE